MSAADGALFNGDYVPIKQVTVPIQVLGDSGLESRDQVFEIVPHHGVIMTGSKMNGKATTRRWVGHEPRSSFGVLVDRLSNQNIDEFMDTMSQFVTGAQNWNAADTAGNTGYIPGARIPVRA